MDVQRHTDLTVGIEPEDVANSELTALIPRDETAETVGEESDTPRGITCSQIIGGSIGNVLEVPSLREQLHIERDDTFMMFVYDTCLNDSGTTLQRLDYWHQRLDITSFPPIHRMK